MNRQELLKKVHEIFGKVTLENHNNEWGIRGLESTREISRVGWAQYHRYVASSEVFSHVDKYVYDQLWRMLHRRHSNKSKGWLIKKYWTALGKKWVFAITRTCKKKVYVSHVLNLGSMGTKRYIKIKSDANPYLRKYRGYFWKRRQKKDAKYRNQLPARETQRVNSKRS